MKEVRPSKIVLGANYVYDIMFEEFIISKYYLKSTDFSVVKRI